MGRVALIALIAALAAAAGGCGFHLQGRADYAEALEPLYLDLSDRSTPLARQLRRSLAVSRLALADRQDEAAATLEILQDSSRRVVESVSAQNRPQEYRVIYEASYRVVAGSRVLLPPQHVSRNRIYPYDERQVLAKAHEEEMLRDALARDIAGVIVRRMATVEMPPATSGGGGGTGGVAPAAPSAPPSGGPR